MQERYMFNNNALMIPVYPISVDASVYIEPGEDYSANELFDAFNGEVDIIGIVDLPDISNKSNDEIAEYCAGIVDDIAQGVDIEVREIARVYH